MIADELACKLANELVRPGCRVLDPFCGTGRTVLAAAERGAECVAVDVNPLASLVTRAKSANPNMARLRDVLLCVQSRCVDGSRVRSLPRRLEVARRVRWFSGQCSRELFSLLDCLNDFELKGDELTFVAAVLSATAREVSYCRDDQWKLHRLSPQARRRFFRSPHRVFERRLGIAMRDLGECGSLKGSVQTISADARILTQVLRDRRLQGKFDLVLTSPPYGDSRTTVQYGAMSAICLGVVRHLHGLDIAPISGGEIDRQCLGGGSLSDLDTVATQAYWRGGRQNPARNRVARFVHDVEACCEQLSATLGRGGRVVVVLARRSVGGWRFALDELFISTLEQLGVRLQWIQRRQIQHKLTPSVINARSRAAGARPRRVSTMQEEWVLAFKKS